jgi:hypothetical protein
MIGNNWYDFMCRLGFGLKAPALVWFRAVRLSTIMSRTKSCPKPTHKTWLAWLQASGWSRHITRYEPILLIQVVIPLRSKHCKDPRKHSPDFVQTILANFYWMAAQAFKMSNFYPDETCSIFPGRVPQILG